MPLVALADWFFCCSRLLQHRLLLILLLHQRGWRRIWDRGVVENDLQFSILKLLIAKGVLHSSSNISLGVGEVVVSLSKSEVFGHAIDLIVVKSHLRPGVTSSNGKALILWDAIHWPCSLVANEVRQCTLRSDTERLLNCLGRLEQHVSNVITVQLRDSVLGNLDEVSLLSIGLGDAQNQKLPCILSCIHIRCAAPGWT
eukprot:Skav218090  [mRNA]  locus=scaffold1801:74248:76732:+ [translate_table: standard]